MDTASEMSFEDAVFKLVTIDDKLQVYNQSTEITPHLAFAAGRGYYSNRGRGSNIGGYRGRGGQSYSTRGRGFQQQFAGGLSSNTRPTCQICGRFGHSAVRCYNRFDQEFESQDTVHTALAAVRLTDQEQQSGQDWFPDYAASAHITNSQSQLQSSEPYLGNDQVIVGNGDYLPITHVGSIAIHTPQGTLPLRNVLVCPSITKSLLSVSKLTKDYPCEFTFDDECVCVKDKGTKRVIAQGRMVKDLYVLKDMWFKAFYSSRQRVTSDGVWHQRLGHPHKEILQLLAKNKSIVLNKKDCSLFFDSCQLGKSCRLPFLASETVISKPLERISCDLWGPSPVVSTQGFKYYVIFIDNHSRFTWFFPLKLKSDFLSVFVRFQTMVENQFQSKIKQFQFDGGGEFIDGRFQTLLASSGIKHLICCPHTPQQNGLAERKHMHFTELGLTMLYHSKAPRTLWLEAFFTANFLGNLLPSSVLEDNKSPFEKLYGHAPVYTSLRVFGCKCFPYLRPYMKNKLDPKSLPCVFLGYNEKYKGYRCFHPPTKRVYISRHVLFDEGSFPFADLYSKYQDTTNSPLRQAWLQTAVEPVASNSDAVFTEEDFPPLTRVQQAPTPPSPVIQNPQSPQIGEEDSDDEVSDAGSEEQLEVNPPGEPVQQPLVPPPAHTMTTRARSGIVKPNPKYALFTVKTGVVEPRSVKAALKDKAWTASMDVEIDNMKETETFELVPPEDGQNPLGCQWIYKIKLNADGTVLKLRSRLVARGNEQEEGVDFLETFSPVIRTATIRTVLHVAVTKSWQIRQLDVQNAVLHGDLKEKVYMVQPPGYVDPSRPDHVWRLKKAIYGLRQAPRAWFDKFSNFLLEFGFQCSFPDPSLFIYHQGTDLIYLLLYVDDMILTGNNEALIERLLQQLSGEFRMKDMGDIHYFLGIQVHHTKDGLFMNQSKYVHDLLVIAGMQDSAPMPTPLPMKLDKLQGQDELFSEPSYFRSLAGKLQYLTLTRPYIQFSVNYICQKMHQPSVSDFALLKRVLRYVKGTSEMGITINRNTDSTLLCYNDSDWAGCKDTRRSTGGFCTFLGANIISWSARRHETVSKSSTEAEYRTMFAAASEVAWLQNMLKIMGLEQRVLPLLLCDNFSAVCLSANPRFHKRTKHFEVDYHYVRERVAMKKLEVKHIPASLQIADVFTKSLGQDAYYRLRNKLSVSVPTSLSLRGSNN